MVGKDELTTDEENQKTLDFLIEELRSYGTSLMNISVQGTASPEGGLSLNVELAKKRARKILSMIGSHIRSASLTVKDHWCIPGMMWLTLWFKEVRPLRQTNS